MRDVEHATRLPEVSIGAKAGDEVGGDVNAMTRDNAVKQMLGGFIRDLLGDIIKTITANVDVMGRQTQH